MPKVPLNLQDKPHHINKHRFITKRILPKSEKTGISKDMYRKPEALGTEGEKIALKNPRGSASLSH